MARRRMRRGTGRFLLSLSAVAICVATVGLGVKWLFSSEPTELTGRTAPSGEPTDAKAGLKPIVSPASSGKKAGPNSQTPGQGESPLPNVAPRAKSSGSNVPVPPTTQPTEVAKLSANEAQKEIDAGFSALDRKELTTARSHLNRALHSGLSAADEKRVRAALVELAQQTIFSRSAAKDDTLTERYTVKSGDRLSRIARQFKISEDLLAEVNGLADKNKIRVGMTLKVIHGPFNAAVEKSKHVLHVYLQDVYLRTYRVALGADGSTPTGTWKVKDNLANPDWVDPQGKRWHANDPKNPIGEFWIGLEGIEGEAVGKLGFGIHGTVEPETIGQDVSLGCVRLAADDIATLYKLLVPGASVATITD